MWYCMTPYVSYFLWNRHRRHLFRTEALWTIFLWHLPSRCYIGSLVTKLQIPSSTLGIKSLKFRIAFYIHNWDLPSFLMITMPNQTASTWFKRQCKPKGFSRINVIQSPSQSKPDSRQGLIVGKVPISYSSLVTGWGKRNSSNVWLQWHFIFENKSCYATPN